MMEWNTLDIKLKGTGDLTVPGTHALNWEGVNYMCCGSYAPWDRHNNNNPYRLSSSGNFAQFSINSFFMTMKSMLIEADFTPSIAHVLLVNKILWVDICVSKGPGAWASDGETKDEYNAMAWYQLDEVKDLIKAVADKCPNLISFLLYGQKAKDALLKWAYNTFSERGIFLQPLKSKVEHAMNIGLRRVNKDNADGMVNIFRSLFAVTDVKIPPISDEILYENLPTKSTKDEVDVIINKQYSDTICAVRHRIVQLYNERDRALTSHRQGSQMVVESVEVVLDESSAEAIILGHIFVFLPNRRSITIHNINFTQTITDLKTAINSMELLAELSWDEFDLVYRTDVLDDEKSIDSYNIISGVSVMIKKKISINGDRY
jgi:hypothetical protein